LSPALVLLAILSPAGRITAEEVVKLAPVEPAATVPGTLFICGGGKLPDAALKRFVDLAGGPRAHVVVITTASETADSAEVESRIDFWRKARLEEMTVLHTRARDVADDEHFCRPLESATGVWFIGGNQDRLTQTYLGTRVERSIRSVLERGGVVGGTSAGAAIMSPVMIRGGNPLAEVGDGFGFLPGTVVDQHFLKRKRQDRLLNVLSVFPQLVGVGIDEGTAVVVSGRRLSVIHESESEVVTYLAPVDGKPSRMVTLKPGDELDLVAARRAAITRVQPRTRYDNDLPVPGVPQGTLVLVGGGETPIDAARRFIAEAGGPDAPMVVVSTAVGERAPPEEEVTGWLLSAGARKVQRVHARTRQEAEDPAVLGLFQKASGVWFTGGRQWRLVDAFLDTAAERLFHEVLKRGGVIGGSAAGASMSAGYLVRGNPLDNRKIMAEGYEDGFGFLPGAAVDPFFSQRNRFSDMAELKQSYPQLVGLGLDEGTAVVVKGHELEVLGRHRVCVFDRRIDPVAGDRPFDVLQAGDRYDLNQRRRMGSPRADEPSSLIADAQPSDSQGTAAADDGVVEPRPQPALVCE
jgi:cyanophycinase